MASSLRRLASAAPNATRFASAAVLIPLCLIPTILGHEWFVGLLVGIAAAAAWELATLQEHAGFTGYPVVAVVAAVAFPVATAVGALSTGWILLAAAVAVGLFLLGYAAGRRAVLGGWALSLAAGLYPGVLLAGGIMLRERADGLGWVLLVLIATWACDTAAFFVGRRWGRRKLAPAISPGKTIEGLVAGLLAAVVVAGLASAFLVESPARTLGLGLVVAVGAVIGDLAESAMKRQLGAKDSGWLVPGHGGLLDRVDSLLFTGFLGYLYVTLSDGVFRA